MTLISEAAPTGTDDLNMIVVGGQELGARLGTLIAEVECNGTTIVVKDLRTGRIRASIVPGLPNDLADGADLVAGYGEGGA